jgi:hypothetical protein
MDPNATLEAIFDSNDIDTAIEYCEYLADWLRKGGFVPTVKKGHEFWAGTNTPYAILNPIGTNFEGLTANRWHFVRYNSAGERVEAWILNHE